MGYRFNPPPNWPAPPANWTPPQGWVPDAAWGPAPSGWNFWVEDASVAGPPPVGMPFAPAAARPKNWFMRHKILTGIGALFLLGTFSGIATAAGGGGATTASGAGSAGASADQVAAPAATSAPPKASPAAKPSPKAVAAPKPVAAKKPAPPASQMGKVVKDGKFAFKVSAVKCGISKVGTDFLSQNAQGQYCRVTMTVQNIGDEAQTMFADNQYLFDSKGRKFSADSGASLYDDSSKMLWEEINPGNTIHGNVFFDVPKGIKLSKLELHDSMFSGGVEVRF